MTKTPELIAPAGSLEKMKTAFLYGADAVYLGLPDFSLRARINDFKQKTLSQAIAYAHSLKKKVYITLNILAHDRHLSKLPAHLKKLKLLAPDAIIVSDPGVLSLVRKYCPRVKIHLSTQANCTNSAAVKFWAKQGVSRIILARELSLKEIKKIHSAVPKMELEYFVHGAMCLAYSGRCLLSQELLGRNANEGDCAQPCRFEYEVFLKAKNHQQTMELVQEKHGGYLLNSRDLCLIEHLPELKKAGISSYKIEGRAKSSYYLATVVSAYRRAILHPQDSHFLFGELKEKLINRGYSNGFLLGGEPGQNVVNSHNPSNWEFCGQVIGSDSGRILVRPHNSFSLGDELEIILPGYDIIKIKAGKILDAATGAEISSAHGGGGGQKVFLEIKGKLIIPAGVVLRRKIKK